MLLLLRGRLLHKAPICCIRVVALIHGCPCQELIYLRHQPGDDHRMRFCVCCWPISNRWMPGVRQGAQRKHVSMLNDLHM